MINTTKTVVVNRAASTYAHSPALYASCADKVCIGLCVRFNDGKWKYQYDGFLSPIPPIDFDLKKDWGVSVGTPMSGKPMQSAAALPTKFASFVQQAVGMCLDPANQAPSGEDPTIFQPVKRTKMPRKSDDEPHTDDEDDDEDKSAAKSAKCELAPFIKGMKGELGKIQSRFKFVLVDPAKKTKRGPYKKTPKSDATVVDPDDDLPEDQIEEFEKQIAKAQRTLATLSDKRGKKANVRPPTLACPFN